MDGINEDPESPLNLSQSNNLVFYISRNHSLATKVDDVTSLYPGDSLLRFRKDGQPCTGFVPWGI